MSMIEVDRKLFIKCRLCLEDSGTYQIVPVIQEQISYCFDINVELFDGLPQLICKKCQSILSEYYKIKESYIENQKNLKKGAHGNQVAIPAVGKKGDYSRPAQKRKNSDTSPNNNIKQRKVINTSDSSDSECTRKSENDLVIKEIPPANEDRKVENNPDVQKSAILSESEEAARSENNIRIRKSSLTSKTKQDWKYEYQKTFSCRLCSKTCPKYRTMKQHTNKHEHLKTTFADIFKKHCVVEIPKIDTAPNVTGSMKKVVYSKNKIISNVTSLDYLVTYKRTPSAKYHHLGDDDSIQNQILDRSSDTSSISRTGKRSRRYKRICSNSSTDTVVLENKIKKSDIDYEPDNKSQNECINIDDTDSNSEKNKQVQTKQKNKKNIKADAIAKLMATTHKTYMTKHDKPEKPSLEQLNRKVTSIGRQIINKSGFNCARLINYMEHMNLNVIWIPRSPVNVTNNSNYIKIIPRLRNPNEKNVNDFEGYKYRYTEVKPVNRRKDKSKEDTDSPSNEVDYPGNIDESDTGSALVSDNTADISSTGITSKSIFDEALDSSKKSRKEIAPAVKTNIATEVNYIVSNDSIVPKATSLAIIPVVSNSANSSSIAESTVTLESSRKHYSVTVHATDNVKDKMEASASLDTVLNNNTAADTRKLLNANPVANPRQLPKKFVSETKKDKSKNFMSMPTLEISPNELFAEVTSDFGNEMQMPIITMTRSLAVPEGDILGMSDEPFNKNLNSNFVSTNNENTTNQITVTPRIKVKSVAELMSQETLDRMRQPSVIVSPINTTAANGAGIHDVTQLTINDVRSISTNSDDINKSDDYVILDTVELPNTKSHFPFKYFKTLLQMHNLILLDTDVTLTGDFHTLIRFKVLYKQETKDQPVILCLSLFCLNNIFCLKIKDRNEININMSKISANWQWEILKIYRGEVVSKLLYNAQKISTEVFENTNRFLCLLKSINLVQK